jgi:hypothetical protein
LKIGRYVCILEDYKILYNSFITCNTGDYQSGIYNNFLFSYTYGKAFINTNLVRTSFQTTPLDFDNGTNYLFRIFPKIDSISANDGFVNGGRILTISGKGFKMDDTKVFIDNTECLNLRDISSTSITCTTKVTTFNPSLTEYYGSRGLRHKRWKLASFSFAALTTKMLEQPYYDDIALETTIKPEIELQFGTQMEGLFRAPVTGKYKFYSASDDLSQIYLTYVLPNAVVKTKNKIVDIKIWVPFNDISRVSSQSDWISLTGGEFYPIEILHIDQGGSAHLSVGVEIKDHGLTINKNTIQKPFQEKISFKVNYARDLYEIPIETINVDQEITLGCKNSDQVKIKISDSAETINSKLMSITENQTFNIVRKYYKDVNRNYIETVQAPKSDYTYNAAFTFDNMYLNLNPNKIPQTGLVVNKSGTATHGSILFYVDKRLSERTFRFENECYSVQNGSVFRREFTLLQSASKETSGTFQIVLTETVTNTVYKSSDIDITNYTRTTIQNAINSFEPLKNNYNIFWEKFDEEIIFIIEYPRKVQINNQERLVKDVKFIYFYF